MTLLIGASVLLIAASAIALVFGWAAANESLIWTSIAASVGAAIALALAFFRSRQEVAAAARRATRAPEPHAAAGPAEEDASFAAKVVGSRDSKRYHRPECRYASSRVAEPMSLATARKHGFRPCGICKP